MMKKQLFTLVEVLIASAISVTFLGMVIAVVIQVYDTSRDNLIDVQLNEYSRIISEKITRTYGLRQAIASDVSVTNNRLSYRTFPQTEDLFAVTNPNTSKVAATFKVENGGITFTKEDLNDDDKAFDYPEIDFVSGTITKIDRVPSNYKTVDLVQIRMLFKIQNGNKSYLREEFIKVPLKTL